MIGIGQWDRVGEMIGIGQWDMGGGNDRDGAVGQGWGK